jgi:hypothetical protein
MVSIICGSRIRTIGTLTGTRGSRLSQAGQRREHRRVRIGDHRDLDAGAFGGAEFGGLDDRQLGRGGRQCGEPGAGVGGRQLLAEGDRRHRVRRSQAGRATR